MSIKSYLINLIPLGGVVYAHCDIPCGIYDPHLAQLAAHTVIRMNSLINDLKISDNPSIDDRKNFIHDLSRYTKVKEEHAELIKHEIRVLWGDYFKEEHLKQYPDLSNLVLKTMKLASKARQEIDMEIALELLKTVQDIAEIFFKTKNLDPIRVTAPYPTGGEIVINK